MNTSVLPTVRPLVLCADDFGQSRAIDDGILQLVAQGRLSAVSCMVNGPAWHVDAARLMAESAVREGRVSVGLHLNLTEGRPLSPALASAWPALPALPTLLWRAHLRRLPMAAVCAEATAQWAAFETHAGRAPDHLDGHQHVHHLPGVRSWVLAQVAAHPALQVRHTGQIAGPGAGLKRAVIAHSGGRALGRQLRRCGAAQNGVLLGAYDFAQAHYRGLMQSWLQQVPAAGALLFCHPGQACAEPDAIAAARVRELAYLASPAFGEDLQQAGVRLSPRTTTDG